ncbi:MAG: class I SAM-dependent methyltransferase [Bacteroidota bacterium]
MESDTFWDQRVKDFGHTGWSNPMVYAFDQAARIATIERLLSDLSLPKNLALDYGCGVGDFSKVLTKYFDNVIACDISEQALEQAKRKNSEDKLQWVHPDAISYQEESMGLVLSVTVLGHLMKEQELEALLSKFHKALMPSGCVIAMEFAPQNTPSSSSAYQKFRCFDDWKNRFEEQGFELSQYYGFYHPTLAPCPSFSKYKTNLHVRFWNLLSRFFKGNNRFESLANPFVANHRDYSWPGKPEDPIKIMVFQKKK